MAKTRPDDIWLTEAEVHVSYMELPLFNYGYIPKHAFGVRDKYDQSTPWEPFIFDPSFNSLVWRARFTPKKSDLEKIAESGSLSDDELIETLLAENRKLRRELEELKKI